jgi:hypothetical protein
MPPGARRKPEERVCRMPGSVRVRQRGVRGVLASIFNDLAALKLRRALASTFKGLARQQRQTGAREARGDFGGGLPAPEYSRGPPYPCGLRERSACCGKETLSSRPRWERGQCWHYAQPLLLPPQPSTETLAVVRRGKSRSCRRAACRPKADRFGWLCRSQTW